MRTSRIAGLAGAGLLLPGLLCAAEDAPGWMAELTKVSLPEYAAKVNTVVLLNEEHTSIGESGKLTTVTRSAIKFLTPRGVDVLFYDQYDASSSKVRDFRAWMISPSGKVKKYGKDEILDVACADNDVYNECRKRMVSGKRDAEAGAVFGYESTVEYESFSYQWRFHFQDSSPVRLARVTVTARPGLQVKSSSFNGAPPEPVRSGDSYTWQMENLAALEPEPSAPSFLSLAPWVGVNVLGVAGKPQVLSWPEASSLLVQLHSGQSEPDAAITAKARSLVEGAATEFDKIRVIAAFAQQLNYVSIQVNVSKGGGYRPHPAVQTFQKSYGDCKDKANLLNTMLKAVGIAAHPVAVYSGDRTHVSEEWPSLGAFNHAISAIKVGAQTKAPAVLEHPRLGRLLFFDPTDPHVVPGYLPDHEQGSLALVGAEGAGDLVRLPSGLPAAGSHAREVHAVLGPEGSITGRFVETRSGEALANAVAGYRGNSKADYVRMIERWVGQSVPGAATSGVEVTDQGREFVLKGQFTSARFAQRPQSRMLIFKAALLNHGDLRFTEKTRKYPVALDPNALRETVRIQLPPGFKIDELPDAMHIESPFGKYEATWAADGDSVVFNRTFEMGAQTVPAARYSELRRFLDAVTGSADSPVVLVQ